MPQFSTHETVSLEKDIHLNEKIVETSLENIDQVYEISRCAEWIRSNGFQKVCLQFPDHLLADSTEVALKLQNILVQTIYVLGDTAYESCCIDYVAAAHINADSIIHFGPTCFSKTSANIAYLNIYEKYPVDVAGLERCFSNNFCGVKEEITLLLDSGYIYRFDDVSSYFKSFNTVKVQKIDDEELFLKDKIVVFIGNNERKLLNIDLSYQTNCLYYFDPNKKIPEISLFQVDPKILKRRYFLMEKIKDSRTVGIVIGTLGVKNYLKVIDRIKKLVELSGKKYYLISVGKPTVAKLANFAEIDIYVMITCSMNEVYESREFYKPIVTPFDIEMALNTNTNNIKFSYDYNRYLNNLEDLTMVKLNRNETDVSLLTGKLRSNGVHEEVNIEQSKDSAVALKSEGTVSLNTNFGAGFLNDRSWKGLEQNLGHTEVKIAEAGRKGIAQGYENEKK